MACKWERSSPAVSAMLREGLEDCLTVLGVPDHHRKRLSNTYLLENMLKRLNRLLLLLLVRVRMVLGVLI